MDRGQNHRLTFFVTNYNVRSCKCTSWKNDGKNTTGKTFREESAREQNAFESVLEMYEMFKVDNIVFVNFRQDLQESDERALELTNERSSIPTIIFLINY